MEDVKVLKWIENSNSYGYIDIYSNGNGSGDGSGFGSSYSNGDGSGDGSGYGYSSDDDFGSGYGYSSGDGYGSGYGYSDGIKSFNGEFVYMIDEIQTIISNIKGNLAKGFILNSDLTLSPCYICKNDKYFAHGETLKEVRRALQEKILENMDTDEAIERFLSTFEKEKKYPVKDFYEWHHYLTGSCEMGRKSFMRDRNVTFDDTYTVDEFIALCENSYGGEIIKELKERWNSRNGSN